MSIEHILEKIKPLYFPLLIVVIASIFFAFGRLSSVRQEKTPIQMEYANQTPEQPNASNTASVIESVPKTTPASKTTVTATPPADGPVIGSRSGKKYYFPWCGTVKRIKPENQIHFTSSVVAKAAGFTPGGNCKGLQ